MEKLSTQFQSDIQFTDYNKRAAFRQNAGHHNRVTMKNT